MSGSQVLHTELETQTLGIAPSRAETGAHSCWGDFRVFEGKYVSAFQFRGKGKSHQLPGPPLSHL